MGPAASPCNVQCTTGPWDVTRAHNKGADGALSASLACGIFPAREKVLSLLPALASAGGSLLSGCSHTMGASPAQPSHIWCARVGDCFSRGSRVPRCKAPCNCPVDKLISARAMCCPGSFGSAHVRDLRATRCAQYRPCLCVGPKPFVPAHLGSAVPIPRVRGTVPLGEERRETRAIDLQQLDFPAGEVHLGTGSR